MSLYPRWWDLKVSLLDVATPLTVLPSVSCQDAIDIMNKEGFDQLPVVDQAGSVVAVMWCSREAGKMLAG